MTDPRLLVSLARGPMVADALRRHLPQVPWAYLAANPDGSWPKVEALLVGSAREELGGWAPARTPRLTFVQTLWTGLDDFPFRRFPPAVRIAGNVGAFAPAVAEHAVTLLLALAHDVRGNHDIARAGRLRPVSPRRDLSGGIVLLLGFGEIAREAARRLRPFGPRLHGLSRRGEPDPEVERMFPASALHDALSLADFVIDCRPLTAATRGTIDRDALATMKPTAIYVNVGRAGTVNEEALFDHLSGRPEFRAALDVWWDEDFATDSVRQRFPFFERPNFLGSPHNAGESSNVAQRGLDFAARNLGRFFAGEAPAHLADRGEYPRDEDADAVRVAQR